MKYLMIPLRYLCTPEQELPSPGMTKEAQNTRKQASLLSDVERGVLPSWPISAHDLRAHVTIVDGPDLPDPYGLDGDPDILPPDVVADPDDPR